MYNFLYILPQRYECVVPVPINCVHRRCIAEEYEGRARIKAGRLFSFLFFKNLSQEKAENLINLAVNEALHPVSAGRALNLATEDRYSSHKKHEREW